MKVWITKATNDLCKLHATRIYAGPNVQNLKGHFQTNLDNDVCNKLKELGADLNNPDSIHKAIVDFIKE